MNERKITITAAVYRVPRIWEVGEAKQFQQPAFTHSGVGETETLNINVVGNFNESFRVETFEITLIASIFIHIIVAKSIPSPIDGWMDLRLDGWMYGVMDV